jgi:pimeloyl-ACP methyl ester carboxylesterase
MNQYTVDIAAVELAYRKSDGHGREIVFVHGNSSSSATWDHLLEGPFGQRFECYALDLPGHGKSWTQPDPANYSIPGHASMVAWFVRKLGLEEAVLVGWSLGGHITLEAAELLPAAAGVVIFGAPPVASPAAMAEAFLPNPAMNVGFSAEVTPEYALAYATSFLAPGSTLSPELFTADILATDGAARAGLMASIGEGRVADEVAIASALPQPLAILQGEFEQLVSLDYLRTLAFPTLWRGAVQVIAGAGHAAHQETPERFESLLTEFVADLP